MFPSNAHTNKILPFVVSFCLLPLDCRPEKGKTDAGVVDCEGNRYATVKIGTQVWMAENLRVTRTPEGEPVFSHLPNDDSLAERMYGRLYDWQTAIRVAPSGWHVPSDGEWNALEEHLGTLAAAHLKDTLYWRISRKSVTNEAGFSARPAGYWNDGVFDNQFGSVAVFWSSTRADSHFVWSRTMSTSHDTMRRAPQHPQYGFSVRCIRDNL
jgi:uncharacterized protein (TIGR02145 family)